jgi:hypothetical protein
MKEIYETKNVFFWGPPVPALLDYLHRITGTASMFVKSQELPMHEIYRIEPMRKEN